MRTKNDLIFKEVEGGIGKPYLGLVGIERTVFRHSGKITDGCGLPYNAIIGPFKTLRGARFMRDFGFNNPHLQTVEDAENLAKQESM